MSDGFRLDDLGDLFARGFVDGPYAVLVGGQAVNYWSTTISDRDVLAAFYPLASRDVDFHGGPIEARRLAKNLNIDGRFNDGSDPSPNAAVLTAELPDRRTILIDVLTSCLGISGSELASTAVTTTLPDTGVRMRVIHPMLLLESKLTCLRQLPQVDRQDAKHAKVLGVVLKNQLRSLIDNPRGLFRSVERLFELVRTPVGRHAATLGIHPWGSVPLDAMRDDPRYADFIGKRLPQMEAELRKD